MPTLTYEQLLAETIPAVIDDAAAYSEISRRFGALLVKGRQRSAGETKLMHLLGVLVEDYDRRHALLDDGAEPAERLRFLLEHSGKSAAALLPVFGQRSHVSEALSGKRNISAEQARKLGHLFGVRAGLFV